MNGTERQTGSIDYLVLVNKLCALPADWEERLDVVSTVNTRGNEVEVERAAFEAFLRLKEDLEKYDGVFIELDSARRTVAVQQGIMDFVTAHYGAGYAAKTVAPPGHSEHHTGLALDLYFRLDGRDVFLNEEMVRHTDVWAKIHARLADNALILRYPKGKEHITGYDYEPWHMRYVGDPAIAREIMAKGLTLEEYLGAVNVSEVEIDYGASALYSKEEIEEAMVQAKCRFAFFAGCELHSLRYAGDACCDAELVRQLNELDPGHAFAQACELLSDFRCGEGESSVEYADYPWRLARAPGGSWQLVSWGRRSDELHG